MEKITVRDFRGNLSHYLDKAGLTLGTVLQIGDERKSGEIVVMSANTLSAFENRHVINRELLSLYRSLGLTNYKTISMGKETNTLPIDVILTLTDLFLFCFKILTILGKPNVKTNAMKWDVTKYINKIPTSGTFSDIDTVIRKLLDVDALTKKTYTLNDFFVYIACDNCKYNHMIAELPTEQFKIVYEATQIMGHFMSCLLQFQDLQHSCANVQKSFQSLIDWYTAYIAEITIDIEFMISCW